jgi:hypothetical protein
VGTPGLIQDVVQEKDSMNEVIRCNACGARLVDTFADVFPACRADLKQAGLHLERVGSVLRRSMLGLVGVVVFLVIPKVFRLWPRF